ncbi:hypothetical protein KCP75_12905 [Salmonella enterica subsp. enterica]|nr:hypothetical protein KCP75_12905 [Salmonella enterica subsp. enterica]
MKNFHTANDIRAAHARGEQAMSVVCAPALLPRRLLKWRELLGFTITEIRQSVPASTSAAQACKAKSQHSGSHHRAAPGRAVY